MPAFASMIINDGQATPVAHTFNPVTIDAAGVAKWADRSGGIALGFPTASLAIRSPNKDSRNYKVTLKIAVPTLEVTSPSTMTGIQPAPTLAYLPIADVVLTFNERSTLAERKNLNAYLKNILAHANWTSAIESLETQY